jgi:thiamine biosynthesis lipoprotein
MEAAYSRIQEISDIASIYDPQSQMSLLNQEGVIEYASPELVELASLSKKYYEISGGSFDITISPVLKLWQEGLWKESQEVQDEKVGQALELVGSDMITIEGSRIYFTSEGMSADLGGIAKGYAVDKALDVLEEYGITSALVNAGGDVGTIGKKADGEKWIIELDDPDDLDGENLGPEPLPSFEFEDMAVATSGNYYRYYDPEKRVHHITDPKTGFSANKCISATIIAENCTEADVLATTVFVQGPVEGMELVESLEGVETLIIDSEGKLYQSSGLLKYIK